MLKSEQINELATALSMAQGAFPTVKKDSSNPFFKSKYADLAALIEAVQKPLAENGLAIIQCLSTDTEAKFVRVETILTHKSGQFISDVFSLPVLDWKPQGLGSATTYARRYALQSFLNLGAADDDGNAAQGPQDFTPRAKQGHNSDIQKPRTAPSTTQPPAIAPEPPNAQQEAFQDEDYPEFTDDMMPKVIGTVHGKGQVLPPEPPKDNSPKSKGDTNRKVDAKGRGTFWAQCRKIADGDDNLIRAAVLEVTGQESTKEIFVHQTGEVIERLREMVRVSKNIPSPFDSEVIP